MKHKVAVLLALAAFPGAVWAQGTPPQGGRPMGPPGAQAPQAAGQIRGAVLSAADGQPLRSASVEVRNAAGSTLITGALTGADGRFRIEGLRPGQYELRVAALGFTPITRPVSITPSDQQADIGQVRLAASAVAIEGITVTTERREVALAPDRNTYSVRDMPATAGGNAVDVLRNVPSIEVGGDNTVSLRGNQNVVVQINGRPSPMRGEQLGNFLAQLPANLVERVEVIPNPSAKYDPEGMAGIVNIALKQNTDLGLSGGLTVGGGTTGQINASGNLGYQAGPLTLFGSYGYMQDEREFSGYNNIQYLRASTFSEQDITGIMAPESHTFNGSAEYKLSQRDALSANVIVSKRAADRNNLSLLRELDANRSLIGTSSNLSEGNNDDLSLDFAFSYRHTVRPRANEFTSELRFNQGVEDQYNLLTRQPLTLLDAPSSLQPRLETNITDEQTQNWTLQADWTRMLGERTKLESGYKGTLRQMDNDFDVALFSYQQNAYLPDLTRSNAFEYDEQVHAAYGVLSQNVGKFDLQGGLRLERASTQFNLATTGETFDNGYNSFFPSALVAYNLDDERLLKASYSKRIQRPHTRQLNPFGFTPDPLNIFRGNPYLQPEYTHAFELGYQQSFDKGTLQITPFYRHTTDAVRRLQTLDEAGVTTMSFANVATSDSYGADLNGSLRLGRLTGFGGFSAFQQVTDASNLNTEFSNQAFGWSTRANATFRVNSTLDVQGMVMYRAPMNAEQGRTSAMAMTNLALRQKLLGDKASVSLRITDPFNTMGFGSKIDDPLFYRESYRSFGARGVFLSFNYNFGQALRVRQPRQEQQESQDPSGVP